jgi:hypothetical protein
MVCDKHLNTFREECPYCEIERLKMLVIILQQQLKGHDLLKIIEKLGES